MSSKTPALVARKEEEVQALMEAARAVLEQRSFPETARTIFDHARAITGASSGYVALLSPDGQENDVLFLEAGDLPCTVDPTLPMPIRGLRADAYSQATVVLDNDFMGGKWVEYLPEGHVAMQNVLFAPLVIDGEVVGVMGLANKPQDFTDSDAAMAASLAEFASIALRNSRTLDKLETTVAELKTALTEVKTLRGIIPICARCKNVRDEEGYWHRVESYVAAHSEGQFSHGLCEDCAVVLYGKAPE